MDDPLSWALEDPRCVEASDCRDMLWLRILDVKQALGARRYPADGTACAGSCDPLGLAGGTFALDVSGRIRGGHGRGRQPGGPVELDVAALSSIYLGACAPGDVGWLGTDPPAHAGRSASAPP